LTLTVGPWPLVSTIILVAFRDALAEFKWRNEY
jgi:hypothetical protein